MRERLLFQKDGMNDYEKVQHIVQVAGGFTAGQRKNSRVLESYLRSEKLTKRVRTHTNP